MASEASGIDDAQAHPTEHVRTVHNRREILGWFVWTALADWLIFRSAGITGFALFLTLVPLVFYLVFRRWGRSGAAFFCCLMLWLVSARLAWSYSALTVLVGIAFVPALAMAMSGQFPLVLESFTIGALSLFHGAGRISSGAERRITVNEIDRAALATPDRSQTDGNGESRPTGTIWTLLLPVIAGLAFASIFVLANPDLHQWVTRQLRAIGIQIREFFSGFSIWELPFCIVALFIGAGLLRPLQILLFGPATNRAVRPSSAAEPASLYPAFRNTLWTLILLFAVYLGFEFVTLWKREFPEGFYYAGYAHEGAAWLTLALALATLVLSLIFRGRTLNDPRRAQLQGYAWIWTFENLLLAIAVYNRLLIYVGYNGMTMMRMIGFFGITIVVIGLLLVVFKIRNDKSFWWLLRAQSVALALGIAVFALTPVDYLAHRYNVSRILAGDLRPSVMIAVKPIDDEGYFPLLQLIEIDNPEIREGVRAMLAERQLEIESFADDKPWHWTRFQADKFQLYEQLAPRESTWHSYRIDERQRLRKIKAFQSYSMKWY